ncbi:hypothetical protein F383_28907 [Gossypium arboreum]|uniref:Uncharacterized protein n=1 Tax=Gossypium arboreum TaxID=29729 RepID=A0A0B0PIA6_GOSAR|nr:hypothetical protein F383_28907 [Gossypium arboreum]
MPTSHTWSYWHTYIGVTYPCQRIKRGLTRTHISVSYIDASYTSLYELQIG